MSNNETVIFVYDAIGKLIAECVLQVSQTPKVAYLTGDHLGSPRINTDALGSVISRHDYRPFGEEIERAGYAMDDVRKQFTGYERDRETDLDFAQSRYFSSGSGRFSSPDPLFYTAARPGDPQKFNLYVYVRNNPLILIDPDGKDAVARSVGKDGNLVKLTKEDRKALQASLSKLAPGVVVKKNGEIIYKGKPNSAAGTRLVTGIINSDKTVTIAVNHSNTLSTDAVKSDGSPDGKSQIVGGVSDALVNWDPNAAATATVSSGDSSGSSLVEETVDPAITLGHELIHAYNKTRGEYGSLDYGTNKITENGETYTESVEQRELRAVGFGYNQPGDITENELRKELGKPPRVAYSDRQNWRICGGLNPNCN